jgi:hypothetical protein
MIASCVVASCVVAGCVIADCVVAVPSPMPTPMPTPKTSLFPWYLGNSRCEAFSRDEKAGNRGQEQPQDGGHSRAGETHDGIEEV